MKKIVLFHLLFVSLMSTGQMEITFLSEELETIPGVKFEGTSIRNPEKIQQTSNYEGKILIPTNTDTFAIKVSYTGYEIHYDTLALNKINQIILYKTLAFESIVITAQKNAVAVEKAIQKITIISAEQIKSSGAINLGDVLTYQSGIRMSQDNVLGSSMDLAGISGQNVKILIDEIPVIGRQNGNVDLSQINLNNVERIEIIEGPLSVNYGTNALAGTINIITKKKGVEGIQIQINPLYETIGNYNLSGLIFLNKKHHHLTLDGGRNFFDGWTNNDAFAQLPQKTKADTNRVQTWKPKEQLFGGMKYAHSKSRYQYLLYGTYFDEFILNRGLPFSPYYESAFDDEYKTKRLDIGTSFSYNLKKNKISAQLAYNIFRREKSTFINDLTTLNKILSASDGAQDTSKFRQLTSRANYFGDLSIRIKYQVGIDINHSVGWGKRIETGRQEIGDYAGFLTFDMSLSESFILKPGLRFAHNTAYKSPIIPSLNALYKLKKNTFRASAAKGFRSPDLKELYMDFVDINHNIKGNPELKAEDSWNYSLFANWMKQAKNSVFYKIEYGAFYNVIDNLITLGIIENSSYSYINIGKYSTIGQKITFVYRRNRADFNTTFSYIGRYNPDSETNEIKEYAFSPDLGMQLKYTLIKKKLKANLFYKFNGALQSFTVDNNSSILTTTQSPYHILDASLTADFFKKKSLNITLGAKNILNVKQVNVTGQSLGVHSSSSNFNAGRGISMFISVRYSFHSKVKKNEK